jgi:hypothetical protein
MESESCIWLSPETLARLEAWVAGRNTPQKLVLRARIVLMWARGASEKPRPASRRRQLRDAQAPQDQGLAQAPPRFHLHFTPTSASPLNQVERFFGLITSDAIRRGVFRSVAELKTTIEAHLQQHNAEPKPFV